MGFTPMTRHRQRARLVRAAVGGLHQAAAASGDDRVAGPSELGADLAHQPIIGVLAGGAGRAEHRHGRSYLGQSVEPAGELRRDLAHALGVRGTDGGRLVSEPLQELFVECPRCDAVHAAARTTARACRAISRSSRASITSVRTRAPGPVISRSPCPPALRC